MRKINLLRPGKIKDTNSFPYFDFKYTKVVVVYHPGKLTVLKE